MFYNNKKLDVKNFLEMKWVVVSRIICNFAG